MSNTPTENKKLPDQYFLQQKIKKTLEKRGKERKGAVEYLRSIVKENLKIFRDEFNEDYPITKSPEDIIKRENAIVNIKSKYTFDVYFKYITEEKISITIQDSCLFILNKRTNSRTIRDFIFKNDYTETKEYRFSEVLDFLSIALGFEGWEEAKKYEFDILKKPTKDRKNTSELNQEVLDKIQNATEEVKELQNIATDEIKLGIKENSQTLEEVESNILKEIQSLREDTKKTSLPKCLTINVPTTEKRSVVGRKKEIERLYDNLFKKKEITLITGIGGIGKSTLASNYLTTFYSSYNHIIWIENLGGGFDENLVNAKGLLLSLGISKGNKTKDLLFEEILVKLNSITDLPCLMIIDNAEEDLSEFIDYIPKQPNWHTLITSRSEISFFESILELDFLSLEDSIKLYEYYYERNGLDLEIVEEIVKYVDYHTLTIEILAKTAKDREMPPKNIYDFLRNNREVDVKTKHSKKKIDKITTYLCEIFEDLSDLDNNSKILLSLFSCLPPDYHSYDRLKALIKVEQFNFLDLRKSLKSLSYKGWLKFNYETDSFKLHRIIKEVVIHIIKPNENTVTPLVYEVCELLLMSDTGVKSQNQRDYKYIGDEILITFWDSQEPIIVLLRIRLALLYKDDGKRKWAIEILKNNKLSYSKKNLNNNILRAKSDIALAEILIYNRKFKEAKVILDQSIKTLKKLRIKFNHQSFLKLYIESARANIELNNRWQALKIIFKIDRFKLKECNSYDLVDIIIDISTIRFKFGYRLNSCVKPLIKCLYMVKNEFNMEHPSLPRIYFTLGNFFWGKKKYDEQAILFLEKGLELIESDKLGFRRGVMENYILLIELYKNKGEINKSNEVKKRHAAFVDPDGKIEEEVSSLNVDDGVSQFLKEILKNFLPESFFLNFDFVDSKMTDTEAHIYFKEKSTIPREHLSQSIVFDGFHKSIKYDVQNNLFLHFTLCKWKEKASGKVKYRNWSSIFKGELMTDEFANVIKRLNDY